ncbi:MAG: ATP-binding protein [Treponema sp. GWB1_62_6]|nr:MAG: ATP-binding protein [Treponema sp. GWC1_61_84]OHE71556.1 MAG: ATP-binding protein [Treponema sp. GWB1_62_6]HCM26647.1 ATP-binding protein [Treponema sp.]
MRILPIASGKGGVGKSLVAANLAVALAQAGKRVVLADLDLGASNLHLIIGYRAPKAGIGTFLADPRTDFAHVVADTDIPNLRFIPGDGEIPGSANLKPSQKNALARRLLGLDADVLIMDLGAGTHQSILDFFLLSGQGIVVTAPTVTATLNAYLFLKNAVFRLMYSSFPKGSRALDYMEKIRKDSSSLQKLYVPKLLEGIKEVDPASWKKLRDRMVLFRPRLIMNMIDDPKDAERAQKIRRSCAEYLDLQLEHLGIIYRDSMQDVALQARLPILLYKPQSVLSQAIYRIADKLMQSEEDDAPLAERTIEDSFQEAGLEAEVDFEAKMGYVEELLHSGTLTTGDLIETVKTQQFEISQLRKENLFLKSTLTKAISRGFRP